MSPGNVRDCASVSYQYSQCRQSFSASEVPDEAPKLSTLASLNCSALHDRPWIADSSVPVNTTLSNQAHRTQSTGRKSVSPRPIRPDTTSSTWSALHERPAIAIDSPAVHDSTPVRLCRKQPVISKEETGTFSQNVVTSDQQTSH